MTDQSTADRPSKFRAFTLPPGGFFATILLVASLYPLSIVLSPGESAFVAVARILCLALWGSAGLSLAYGRFVER